jgi:hypothetical protein
MLDSSFSNGTPEDMVGSPDISQFTVSDTEEREGLTQDSNKEHMPRVSIPDMQCQYRKLLKRHRRFCSCTTFM